MKYTMNANQDNSVELNLTEDMNFDDFLEHLCEAEESKKDKVNNEVLAAIEKFRQNKDYEELSSIFEKIQELVTFFSMTEERKTTLISSAETAWQTENAKKIPSDTDLDEEREINATYAKLREKVEQEHKENRKSIYNMRKAIKRARIENAKEELGIIEQNYLAKQAEITQIEEEIKKLERMREDDETPEIKSLSLREKFRNFFKRIM